MSHEQHRPVPAQVISASPSASFSNARLREAVLELIEGTSLPPIVQAGHPVLRQRAAAFDGQLSTEELTLLIGRMRDVMHEAPGVGLAAPQLGIPLQLAVLEDRFDVDPATAAERERVALDFLAVLNPGYTALDAELSEFYEGCLSVDGLQAVVRRHRRVRMDYMSPEGKHIAHEYSGWQARIVQHEVDHLNGTLYLDKAEMRSLSANANYAEYWAEPGIEKAKRGLGFLLP